MHFSLYATPCPNTAWEKVRFAVATSQVPLFSRQSWQLDEIVDRKVISYSKGGPHIPLMSLIALLTATHYGATIRITHLELVQI